MAYGHLDHTPSSAMHTALPGGQLREQLRYLPPIEGRDHAVEQSSVEQQSDVASN